MGRNKNKAVKRPSSSNEVVGGKKVKEQNGQPKLLPSQNNAEAHVYPKALDTVLEASLQKELLLQEELTKSKKAKKSPREVLEANQNLMSAQRTTMDIVELKENWLVFKQNNPTYVQTLMDAMEQHTKNVAAGLQGSLDDMQVHLDEQNDTILKLRNEQQENEETRALIGVSQLLNNLLKFWHEQVHPSLHDPRMKSYTTWEIMSMDGYAEPRQSSDEKRAKKELLSLQKTFGEPFFW